jgi:nucleoid-associated protein YejK
VNFLLQILEKHLSKVHNDGDLKNACFEPNPNEAVELITQLGQGETDFVEISRALANKLFTIMQQNPAIPSADVIFAIFTLDETKYLAILKCNYRSSFIHYVSSTEAGQINRLIKQKTTLPNETQKVDECVLVNLVSHELKIIEKQYDVCAEREYYLSKYFLRCASELSYKQKLKILDKSVNKITKKLTNEEDFDKVTKLRSCLAETIEEAQEIKVSEVAEAVFGHNQAYKHEYLEEVKKAGLVESSVPIPPLSNPSKTFRNQKLKTDSGIEINFPSHFYNNKDVMEFINNPDGTISILIKNVMKVMNK